MSLTNKIFGTLAPEKKQILRNILEFLGIKKYSQLAKDNMDEKLQQYLPGKGFFIEAGAYDGIYASNTYYLEKIKGWSGILVEPVLDYYESCKQFRKKSQVFQYALVADSEITPSVYLKILKSESICVSEYDQPNFSSENLVMVKARTLSSIIYECGSPHIDFLSLDVEGFEVEVMKGLDFKHHRPLFILAEVLTDNKRQNLEQFLIIKGYQFIAKLSSRDFLFRDTKFEKHNSAH